ncbi:MAG: hypothetical protein H7222_18135 [Methylotenera sp.]|nr:hypothetical protein [Oligoflexia bacterium]
MRRGQQITTQKKGSGIGSSILLDYAKILGGDLSFSNGTTGAVVRLDFSHSHRGSRKNRSG